MTPSQMRTLGAELFVEDPRRTANEVYDRIELQAETLPLPIGRHSWQRNHAPRVRKKVGVDGYMASGRRPRKLSDVRSIRKRIAALEAEHADLVKVLRAMTARGHR